MVTKNYVFKQNKRSILTKRAHKIDKIRFSKFLLNFQNFIKSDLKTEFKVSFDTFIYFCNKVHKVHKVQAYRT